MTEHTPASELRTAAEKIHHLAGVASAGPWRTTGVGDYGWTVSMPSSGLSIEAEDSEQGAVDTDYIAAMHPGVGLAIADWLTREADLWDLVETVKAEYSPKGLSVTTPLSTHEQALAVARQLNGTAG